MGCLALTCHLPRPGASPISGQAETGARSARRGAGLPLLCVLWNSSWMHTGLPSPRNCAPTRDRLAVAPQGRAQAIIPGSRSVCANEIGRSQAEVGAESLNPGNDGSRQPIAEPRYPC